VSPIINGEFATEAVGILASDKDIELAVKSNCKDDSKTVKSSVNNGDAGDILNKLSVNIATDNSKLLNSAKTHVASISCRTSALPADVPSNKDETEIVDRDPDSRLSSQGPVAVADTCTAVDNTYSANCPANCRLCDSVFRHDVVQTSSGVESRPAEASGSSCSVSSSSLHYKAFNPFPKQNTSSSRRRAMNGVRLGLYAAPPSDGGRS